MRSRRIPIPATAASPSPQLSWEWRSAFQRWCIVLVPCRTIQRPDAIASVLSPLQVQDFHLRHAETPRGTRFNNGNLVRRRPLRLPSPSLAGLDGLDRTSRCEINCQTLDRSPCGLRANVPSREEIHNRIHWRELLEASEHVVPFRWGWRPRLQSRQMRGPYSVSPCFMIGDRKCGYRARFEPPLHRGGGSRLNFIGTGLKSLTGGVECSFSFQLRANQAHKPIHLVAVPSATPNPNQMAIHMTKFIGLLPISAAELCHIF